MVFYVIYNFTIGLLILSNICVCPIATVNNCALLLVIYFKLSVDIKQRFLRITKSSQQL